MSIFQYEVREGRRVEKGRARAEIGRRRRPVRRRSPDRNRDQHHRRHL